MCRWDTGRSRVRVSHTWHSRRTRPRPAKRHRWCRVSHLQGSPPITPFVPSVLSLNRSVTHAPFRFVRKEEGAAPARDPLRVPLTLPQGVARLDFPPPPAEGGETEKGRRCEGWVWSVRGHCLYLTEVNLVPLCSHGTPFLSSATTSFAPGSPLGLNSISLSRPLRQPLAPSPGSYRVQVLRVTLRRPHSSSCRVHSRRVRDSPTPRPTTVEVPFSRASKVSF